MTADVHPLPLASAGQDAATARSVYLDAYLAPFREWLERESVTEILVNRPGELWIEDAGQPGMQRIAAARDRRPAAPAAGRTGRADQPPGDQPRASAARRDAARRNGAGGAHPADRPARDPRALGHGDPPPPPARPAARRLRPRADRRLRRRRRRPIAGAQPIAYPARCHRPAPHHPDLRRHVDRQDHLPQRHAARNPAARARRAGRGYRRTEASRRQWRRPDRGQGRTGRGQGFDRRPAPGRAASAPGPDRAGRAARQGDRQLPARDQHRPPRLVLHRPRQHARAARSNRSR